MENKTHVIDDQTTVASIEDELNRAFFQDARNTLKMIKNAEIIGQLIFLPQYNISILNNKRDREANKLVVFTGRLDTVTKESYESNIGRIQVGSISFTCEMKEGQPVIVASLLNALEQFRQTTTK